jgi:uncharacterized Zn finger protein
MLTKNINCPRCGKPVLRKILKLTEGKCNNCGYLFANSLTKFISNGNNGSNGSE